MKPMIVVAGLAVRDGKMLLQRRPAGKRRPGLWEHPGGKVEPGEMPSAALAREWYEELYDDRDGASAGLQIAGGIGNRITTVHFTVECSIEISLYHVELPSAALVLPREAPAVAWVDPLEAVEHLPLSPGSYLLYPWIRGFMTGDWSLVPLSHRFGASQ